MFVLSRGDHTFDKQCFVKTGWWSLLVQRRFNKKINELKMCVKLCNDSLRFGFESGLGVSINQLQLLLNEREVPQ